MKVTRNAIKKIRKDAKKALKKERRAAKRAEHGRYTVVDLDSDKDPRQIFEKPEFFEKLRLPPTKYEGPEGFHQ